ncbi:alpha/beta fold hydrolase [Falsiroseomonas sp. HW251]|uniref:alpha/beta fold hydrolase n=1 Tax=Falsiroseomonas sp. HW251 TaxID=3390998 RepID=UPI003D314653
MTPRRHRFHARDGLELAAVEYDGPEHRTPILCLSGLTRGSGDFERLAARHAGKRRVIALDHAGHGDSARPDGIARYGIFQSVNDVLDAMAALHAPRAVFVGTSFGGILTMVTAVLRPSCIAGAVLNDIGPALEPAGLDHVQNFVGRDPALPGLEACVAHLKATLPPLSHDEEGWRRFAAGTYAPDDHGTWRPRWDIRIAEALRGNAAPDLWGPFRALAHAPVMLVRGGVSELLSAETAAAMRRARPDMAFVEVPGCGHCPSLEERAVVPLLDRFLDAVP